MRAEIGLELDGLHRHTPSAIGQGFNRGVHDLVRRRDPVLVPCHVIAVLVALEAHARLSLDGREVKVPDELGVYAVPDRLRQRPATAHLHLGWSVWSAC